MDVTEQARRSDALYYSGNDGINRRWLCDKVASLEAESAGLRELASILCFCMQIHKQCDDCKLNGAKGELARDPLCACRELHAMLRELGIEVGE